MHPKCTKKFFACGGQPGICTRRRKYGASPVPLLTVGFLSRPDFVAHRHEMRARRVDRRSHARGYDSVFLGIATHFDAFFIKILKQQALSCENKAWTRCARGTSEVRAARKCSGNQMYSPSIQLPVHMLRGRVSATLTATSTRSRYGCGRRAREERCSKTQGRCGDALQRGGSTVPELSAPTLFGESKMHSTEGA
jgi:hypothetical protein